MPDPSLAPEQPALRLRPAVRAVLADPDGRVLLCRWHFEDPDGPADVWGTPGGGIEPGEDLVDALRRELAEETGLEPSRAACGPVVAHRRHVVPMRSTDGRTWDGQEEWVFLLRVDAFEPHGRMSAEELAAESVAELGWYSLDEIRSLPATAVTAPRALADVLETLLARGHGGEPLELGG
ncbi:MAG: NUDIX domain-containing protein [Nocardioidaceae bacterium]|nr:NUDIX domain-containing protein [Nocardioidaceae bacterium]